MQHRQPRAGACGGPIDFRELPRARLGRDNRLGPPCNQRADPHSLAARCCALGGNVVTKMSVLFAMAGLALAVAGCETPQQQVAQKEDLLAAAGFQVRPADSPHRVAAMKRLPANKFVSRVRDGGLVYLYADPLDCNCVYFGNQQNWDAYKQEMFAKQIADEQQMTAVMEQDNWDWGPWGWP